MNILFTASGRRVSLLRSFRRSMEALGIEGKIFSAESSLSAPASFICDEAFIVPRISSNDYIPALKILCNQKNIKLLIPLIDSDLTILSQHKKEFLEIGVFVLVCEEETNRICFDKKETFDFFVRNNINTPRVFNNREIENFTEIDFPVIIKPAGGSCSIGVELCKNQRELQFYQSITDKPLIQKYIKGEEYTCDVYVDFSGEVRCVVPRKRLEVRAGEVSKALTVNDPEIIHAVKNCVEKLPHAVGCITVQCFKQADGTITFIEINPRFGGGHPLSIHAGADFPKWILQEARNGQCDASFDSWDNNLAMLRYDDEVFVDGSKIK